MIRHVYCIDTKLVAYYLIQRGSSITEIFNKIAELLVVLKNRGDIYVAFDIGTSDFRLGEQSYYKGHRRKATKKLSVADQIKHEKFNEDYIKLVELFKHTEARVLGVPGVEADDLISLIVEHEKERPGTLITLITGDYDYLHMIVGTKNVRMYDFPKDSYIKHDDVVATYDVTSRRQFSTLKSIIGDDSDNIKFIRNLGEVKGGDLYNKIHEKYGDDPSDDEFILEIEEHVKDKPRLKLYEHHIEDGRTTVREAFLSNIAIADPFTDFTKMSPDQITAFKECLAYEKPPTSLTAFTNKSIELFNFPITLSENAKRVFNVR